MHRFRNLCICLTISKPFYVAVTPSETCWVASCPRIAWCLSDLHLHMHIQGASVGLVKNLALLTHISLASPSAPVRAALAELGLVDYVEHPDPAMFAGGSVRVFVNGDLVGTHADPPALVAELRRQKRCGQLDVFTSIVWNVHLGQLILCTEAGRFMRPLFVVDPATGRLALPEATRARLMEGRADWARDLVLSGAVEYMDVEEANTAMVAMKPEDLERAEAQPYTHVEIAPSAMLGVVAGSIPFSDHNQAPRNTYQVRCRCLRKPWHVC